MSKVRPRQPGDSVYCERCGARVVSAWTEPAREPVRSSVASPARSTSWGWWLLPLVLTWVGGLIAWVVVRDDDRKKANRLLWLGVWMTALWIVIVFVLNVLLDTWAY